MACCDWETFKDSFIGAWTRKGVGDLLIDWARAEIDWCRYHCTGGEAAKMQLQVLAREGDYLWLERLNNRQRGDDGGLPVSVPA